jgi:hypothetical protein
MNTLEKIEKLEQRIEELGAGKEIDAKHITVLLSTQRQREFDAQWKRQQSLRKIKKPATLNAYEMLHKQASALLARCSSSATRTMAEQATLVKLQTKCVAAIERAHAEITKQLKKRATLAEWLDRAVVDISDIDETVLGTGNQKTVKHNNTLLNASIGLFK